MGLALQDLPAEFYRANEGSTRFDDSLPLIAYLLMFLIALAVGALVWSMMKQNLRRKRRRTRPRKQDVLGDYLRKHQE